MKHMFDVDIAKEYGVNAAILLEHIGFWVAKNEANNANFYDGTYWTYNSRKAFHELFPYMSEKQIATALKKLEENGLIITGNYNKNNLTRTIWYALSEKGKCILHFGQIDYAKMSNGNSQKVKCDSKYNIYNNNITDIKQTDILLTDIESANAENVFENRSKRKRYGEYDHVVLTEEQYGKLVDDYGKETAGKYIQKVDEYCQMHGKSYKDYNLTIRNWMNRDGVRPHMTAELLNQLGDFD